MLRKYGTLGKLRILFSFFYTKLFFNNARLIRFPLDIRNRRYMKIGKQLTTGFGCRIEAYPLKNEPIICLNIGENVSINDYVHIAAVKSVSIGNNVLMASKIYISDCLHGSYNGDENDNKPTIPPNDRPLSAKEVVIKDNVWLGEFVSVLPGVTIGKGTIVGANSVVSKSLPDYVIAVGTPAKPIKQFNFTSNRWEKYPLQQT